MDGDGWEPIGDDEILYRRIPVSNNFYDPATGKLSPEAFAPHKENDETGLSVSRGKYKSVEEAARNRPGKSYFVAVLRAADLRKDGINVVPRPQLPDGFDPAHAELPDLNSANRKDSETQECKRKLVKLSLEIKGPFLTPES